MCKMNYNHLVLFNLLWYACTYICMRIHNHNSVTMFPGGINIMLLSCMLIFARIFLLGGDLTTVCHLYLYYSALCLCVLCDRWMIHVGGESWCTIKRSMAVASSPAGPVLAGPVFAMYIQSVHAQNFKLRSVLIMYLTLSTSHTFLASSCTLRVI